MAPSIENEVADQAEASLPPQAVVSVKNLVFAYPKPGQTSAPPILQIDALSLNHGERLFIYGPSGCGKTTLLGLLTGVLEPVGGSVQILGVDLNHMRRSERDAFRAAHIGYIFQMFNLLPYLSVLDNILLPVSINKKRKSKLVQSPKESAIALAKSLGLGDHLDAKSNQLSVGQQQRVAAARALIGAPELVIADEPTSSLDADSQGEFLELLFEQCRRTSTALIFVSHDRRLQEGFDRALDLSELNQAVPR